MSMVEITQLFEDAIDAMKSADFVIVGASVTGYGERKPADGAVALGKLRDASFKIKQYMEAGKL